MGKYVKLSISIVMFLWLIRLIDFLLPGLFLNRFGIIPRNYYGLRGIICSPFLHGSFTHLLSNSIPLFVLLLTLFVFYSKIAFRILLYSMLLGNLLVWLMGRSGSVHIGASGLIYSLTAFLIASGILRKDLKSIAIALVIFFTYGGLIWGVLPSKPWISWEGHLFGMISGLVFAYRYRKIKL